MEQLPATTDAAPTPECVCGDDLQRFCSACSPERMKKFQWAQAKAQNNNNLQRKKVHGPILKYVEVAEPGGKKQLHRRMEHARQMMSTKLGRKIGKKEFALVHASVVKQLREREAKLPKTETFVPQKPQAPTPQQVTDNKLKSAIQFGINAHKCDACDYVANGERDLAIHKSRQHDRDDAVMAPERQ